jgi:hypothetical protein
MKRHTDLKFRKRLGASVLIACGLAATAAHADPSTSTTAASTAVQSESAQQCPASTESSALSRFETGTTFTLTENGLIVLKRPAAKKWYSRAESSEPEYLNTGN